MKKIIYGSCVAAVLLLGACGNEDEKEKAETPKTEQATDTKTGAQSVEVSKEQQEKTEAKLEKKNEGSTTKVATFKSDKQLQKAIEQEKGVDSVYVLIDPAAKNVLVDIQSSSKKSVAQKWVTKYAEQFNAKYDDHLVDVRVLNGDKVTAQKTMKAQ